MGILAVEVAEPEQVVEDGHTAGFEAVTDDVAGTVVRVGIGAKASSPCLHFGRPRQTPGQAQPFDDRAARWQIGCLVLRAIGRDIHGVTRAEHKAGVEAVRERLATSQGKKPLMRPRGWHDRDVAQGTAADPGDEVGVAVEGRRQVLDRLARADARRK